VEKKYIRNLKEYAVAGIVLLIVMVVLFNKAALGTSEFVTADSLSPKAIAQGIHLSQQETGEYPLWLPWIFSGLPSVHSFQNISHYYLPNHIFTALKKIGMPWFWTYLLHYVLAGLGVYVLLREIGTSKLSALFGGFSFMLTPYLITMIVFGHGSQMMTAAYIPWVLWALVRLKARPDIFHAAILALLAGLQLQRAHVQIAYYTWLMVGLYLLIQIVIMIKNKNWPQFRFIGLAFAGLALAVGLALVIYLPVSTYAPWSIRGGTGGGTGFEYATGWSFSFGEMMTFLIPSFYGFGGPAYWGSMPFTDYPNYMGIFVLGLAVFGVIRYRGALSLILLLTALFALFLSFGKHLFLYGLFYNWFPYFDKFRVPVMFLILTQFSMAVLAGMGLDALGERMFSGRLTRRFQLILYAIGAILILVFLFGKTLAAGLHLPPSQYPQISDLRIRLIATDLRVISSLLLLGLAVLFAILRRLLKPQIGLAILLGISLLDLALVDHRIIEPSKASLRSQTLQKTSKVKSYLREDEVIRFLKKDTDDFRILPLGKIMNENRWAAFEIESVTGYHPAKLQNYNTLMTAVGLGSQGILRLLNVKYVLSTDPIGHPSLKEVFSGKLWFQEAYVNCYVYEFKDYLSRAFFTENIQSMQDQTEMHRLMKAPEFDPVKTAFLHREVDDTSFSTEQARVSITARTPNRIEATATAETPQFLVFSEVYYPEGWEVTVNGSRVDLYEVDGVLRGVDLPAGTSRIVMEFKPNDLKLGSIISWSSLALILAFLAIPVFRKK